MQKRLTFTTFMQGVSINGIKMNKLSKLKKQQLIRSITLLKTWFFLAKNKNELIRSHAMKMLLDTFGDLESMIDFVKKNNIKV